MTDETMVDTPVESTRERAGAAGTDLRRRVNFDGGWTFTRDHVPVERNTAKSGSCGLAADLSLAEGGRNPIPEHLAKKLSPELMEQLLAGLRTVAGEWSPVHLPDDWTTRTPPLVPANPTARMEKAAADPSVRMGFLPTGVAWYRKVFAVPAEWSGRRVGVEFDGVMRDAHVWVNGCFIGSHYSGYTGFALDLTEHLRYGDEGRNVILVRTDTTSQEGWWAEGGGIYRHVWLNATHPVHIARHGIVVTTDALTADRAELTVRTTVGNDSSRPVSVTVAQSLECASGAGAPASLVVAPFGTAEVVQRVTVDAPAVWRLDDPRLHRLTTRVEVDGDVVDSVDTTFGIRTVAYTGEGLLLNGELTPIHGVCCHQDAAAVGIAVPDRVHEHRIARLKSIGCNAYRTAHHPPTPELLDACDRLGMLVLDENRRLEANEVGLADLAELIRRDRNHPSLFMWSLSNEELIDGTPLAHRILRRMVEVAHHHDPTRPTTIASMFAKQDHAYGAITDVAGFNYDRGDAARYRETHPGAPVMATEDLSYMSTRGIYEDDPDLGFTSSYDEGSFLERTANRGGVALDAGALGGAVGTEGDHLATTEVNRMQHPYLGGVFLWTGFDYRGECAPFGWPAVNAPYGLFDFAGFPKDVAHYWRSRWVAEPVVHVFPHWNWPALEGQPVRVVVYSNCDEVEVLVNGESVATEPVPDFGIVHLAAEYRAGVIEVRGSRAGEVVASCVRRTTGRAVGLRMSTAEPTCRTGGDVVVATVDVVDANGDVVPDACPVVTFSCDGGAEVIGSGSGSPADHVPACEPTRAAFNGHALVVVRSPEAAGEFSISVGSPGLHGATLALVATDAQGAAAARR